MHSVAVLIAWDNNVRLPQTLAGFRQCGMITATAAVVPSGTGAAPADLTMLKGARLWSKRAILDSLKWFCGCGADHLLLIGHGAPLLNDEGLRRMATCLHDTNASIIFGDYYDLRPDGSAHLHRLIDYQPGSIRDDFNFGPVIMINGRFVNDMSKVIGETTPDLLYGGLYDLRLRLCERSAAVHLPEPLYCCFDDGDGAARTSRFSYVDPCNRDYQLEMEAVATAHLQRIGAFIHAPGATPLAEEGSFPVEASIIIPVKNRARTVGDAVKSALSQKTAFSYNVFVIDNHSNDGTTGILATIARSDGRLVHHIPRRMDLLIGGCWNEAIYSEACGRYAVQLDSDDLYNGTDVLERIVAEFNKKPYALVIGSYTTVDLDFSPRAPGLVDHREWTDANGPNNALRIAGLGAPRAYHVPTLRRFGFPNVSYGEDYAAVLRLCRSYPVGRIYDSLYWCRRWEDNSDSALTPETADRYDRYKDRLRTIEIAARLRREECR
ncbi:MAG: glycosyltransferase family 2 protein [Chitinispirillaceae bacterium]|nr:glycosyltransferase family 2 protein [Chitinispirillaceae bacterium]